ncbi:MAG: relaxase/mobilization nuclease domain-containing protein [Pseudotabrizicola sp.]|uniref:relaxase/mobilization nuclease domain-containing protein n=1 Tax=Pseudotabrizicola sp. TaxID=2939647 RepID=UPI002730DCEC|nr:relaxase/mobilization nuclease domain-containing protein [Pseudotabrizicola sp.]MDP2081796.1 relaxase/mobilization nuclease domain-containing protein [Pseudotabrizicola sp.]MDZ7575064.1 relaxase/mobilization nuclease domain-containing protein [Pseudotabrizicola sp.]
MVKLGSRPIGVAEAVLGEINFLRPQQGRVKAGGSSSPKRGFSFSTRASQLWRFSLGSNAAVLKKIGKGGTANAKELAAQMDYLFTKSASIFGNGVVLDADAKGLTKDERNEIVGDWVEDWHGSPKNGHTTHLLMSFPSHVRPEKAKLISEAWAFEMFQSGEHQDDVWSYVAALHTDKAHPHVHMVINNRGTANDSWFFMAKEHVFNLDFMKERMVAIAAEEGVFLDASSRAERGLLTYGPSRAEIERARAEGRAPEEKLREGKALDDALATMARTADAMRSLSHVAALTGLPEIGEKIAKAEEALRRGGVLQPFPGDVTTAERADLDRYFSGWMAEAEGKIRKMPAAERKEMRDELYGYAIDIAKGLGDARGAQLMQMLPQTKIYATGLEGERLTQGRVAADLQLGAADRLKTDIIGKAQALGLSSDRMAERLETGAANAWEERDWVRSDLLALSGRPRGDLKNPVQSRKVVDDLEGFYETVAKLIEHAQAHEAVPENDRLLRALGSMARIMQADGKVEFRGDAHAERFADELRQRYGKGVVAELASGRTDALAGDFGDADQRMWIARAVVSSAKSHVAFGLTLKEARHAERLLTSTPARGEHNWER